MKFSIVAAFVSIAAVMAQELIPECAAPCVPILNKAGCGALTEQTIQCFCAKKNSLDSEVQNCLVSKTKCSLNDLLTIRSRINGYCGSS